MGLERSSGFRDLTSESGMTFYLLVNEVERLTDVREKLFDEKTVALAWANTKQSFIKHFLTEADRIAVGAISPLSDQGGYAVAMNYGALPRQAASWQADHQARSSLGSCSSRSKRHFSFTSRPAPARPRTAL